MARTHNIPSLSGILALVLYFILPILALAAADPHPAPTAAPAVANAIAHHFLAVRQAKSDPVITTTCTSTQFNTARSISVVTGRCVVQACETPTVGLDGRPSTSTGTCTLTPIGGAAAAGATPALGMGGLVAGMAGAVGLVYGAM